MTPLRQRMIDDMQLRGLSARTQEAYVAAVRQLAQHYRRSPDRITEEELRQYFLYLANEKKVARATATITLCAVRFLYEELPHCGSVVLRLALAQCSGDHDRLRTKWSNCPAPATCGMRRHHHAVAGAPSSPR